MDEKLLRQSLEELYGHAPCGYVVTDQDDIIVQVNQTFLNWTGYTQSALSSTARFSDLLTAPSRIFYENQYLPLLRMQGHVKEVAFDIVCRDRPVLPVLVNSVQRVVADGFPLLTVSIVFDATDRRRYERELLQARRRAEQLSAVVVAASDGILSMTPEGRVEACNPGAEVIFGRVAREIVGGAMRDLFPLPDSLEFQHILSELQEGRSVHLETTIRQGNDQQLPVSVALAPHLGLLGELTGISAILRDISERRALERMQHEFLAMTSHELRNPLTSIRGHAQMMKRRSEYSESSVNAIITQAGRLDRLVDDLLLASQIEAKRLTLQQSVIDLVAEVRLAVEQIPADGAPIHLETPTDPLPVLADRHRLGQVFANLLTNAIKYSAAESQIRVRVTRRGDFVTVAVSDQGAGIPPEALPHIFSRFYRVTATADQAKGLGLGLYISHRIVEAHGGRISVESQLGQGTTFTVTLPLRDDTSDNIEVQ